MLIWGKKNFLENLVPLCTTSHRILAPCQNFEKINNTILKKCLDRQKDERTDGRTDERMEGRTDLILQDPSDYCRRSKKKINSEEFVE